MFTLEIDMENAAFGDDPAAEVIRILRDCATRIERGDDGSDHCTLNGTVMVLCDINGNRVGFAEVTCD